jgi:hypothetical protein
VPVLTTVSTNARVIIADVPFDDNNGAYQDQEFQPYTPTSESPWGDYVVRCRYHKSQRRYMLGVTSPNTRTLSTGGGASSSRFGSVAFVQLANPTLLWVVDWTAARVNSKPFAPNSRFYDPQWVLLDEQLEPGQIAVGADDRIPLYRISGFYVYGNTDPDPHVNLDAAFPVAAWVDSTKFDRSIPDYMFKDGIASPPR